MKDRFYIFLHNKWLLLAISLIILGIAAFFYYQKIFSFHFVDEEDNFVLGMYLLQGEKLYGNLFSHHQPLAYIISSLVQIIFHPTNIYKLVEFHREFMIAWSILWILILTFRFGWIGVLFGYFYEFTKIYLLGNLFLSESLVVYPIIYLICWILIPQRNYWKYEFIFLGFCLSLSFMLLAPIWPLIFLFFLCISFKERSRKYNLIFLLAGAVPIIIISIYFSDIYKYFYNVFFLNYKYYLPFASSDPSYMILLKSFFSPIMVFLPPFNMTQTGSLIRIFSLILFAEYFVLIKNKKYFLLFFTFLILGLSNIRYVEIGSQEYLGFHLLVWYANLIVITTVLAFICWNYLKELRPVLVGFFLLAFILVIYYGQDSIFQIDDKTKMSYINYSIFYDHGEVLKNIASPKDTLFVAPDAWLIYSQSGTRNASYMVNYYAWMSYVPSIHSDINTMFQKNPPTYLYCDCELGYFGLEKYFDKYTRMKKEGNKSKLYILPEKLDTLTEDQKNKLKFFGFSY